MAGPTSSADPYNRRSFQVLRISLPGRVKKGPENRISVVSAVAAEAGRPPVMSFYFLACVTLDCPAAVTRLVPHPAGDCCRPVPGAAAVCVHEPRHQSGTRSGGRAFAGGIATKPAKPSTSSGVFRRASSPLQRGERARPGAFGCAHDGPLGAGLTRRRDPASQSSLAARMRAHGRFAGARSGVVEAMIVGREAARTAALRAAEARDGGVKGDGGLVIVIGGSRAYQRLPPRACRGR